MRVLVRHIGAGCVIALAFASCSRPAPEDVESQAPVPVRSARAEAGAITAVVHATGLVTPAPGAELVVVPPEPARIVAMPKAEGDTVRRGDVLVRFEIPSTAAEAAKQRSEIARARARIETARAAETRARDLFDRGVAARKEVEDAARELADAQADLATAQAGAAAAETVAARSIVRATFDGIVARRSHNPGDLVEAAASDPVLRIVDPKRLEVVAAVPLAEAPRVRVGAPARVLDAPPNTPALKVVAHPAAVQPGTTTVPVRLSFAAPPGYPVGSPVQVAIDAETHASAVLVPASAVVREGEDTAVFVVAGKKAVRRTVTVGLESDGRVEITSGVATGETVIARGQNGLPDGATVRPEPAAAGGGPASPGGTVPGGTR